jgi:hypothetical protein
MAKPTKRTPEVIEALCDALAHGLSNEDACAIAKIGIRTFYEWLEDEQFVETIRAAKAQQKLTLIKMLMAADAGQWQKIAWRLERLDIAFCRPEVRLQFLLHQEGKDILRDDKDYSKADQLADLALVRKATALKNGS